MARLKLESDFIDYMDHEFAGRYDRAATHTFKRIAAPGKAGFSKDEQLQLMSDAGLVVPRHGRVFELTNNSLRPNQVVVYTDPFSHRGEGKVLCNVLTAQARYANYYCSAYVEPPPGGRGVSYRMLAVGGNVYWFHYQSMDEGEWRSNCGSEVQVTLVTDPARLNDIQFLAGNPSRYAGGLKHNSLFAIDFVPSPSNLIAVDYNTAPQILNTGLDDVLPAWECYELIENYFFGTKQPPPF